LERLTVPEAARRLGVTPDAVRKRIKRHNIRWEKDEDGRVYVYLESSTTEADAIREVSATERFVEELKTQNEFLREQLEAEREANRENRRLLAAALERIPAIEPPPDISSDAREPPQTASEDVDRGRVPEEPETAGLRPWWRRIFQ
jgi:septal ring factor EnvC (AmiA/AmiB activator)